MNVNDENTGKKSDSHPIADLNLNPEGIVWILALYQKEKNPVQRHELNQLF